ncbi:MAG: YncE family protein [Thermoplasmata archaeon]
MRNLLARRRWDAGVRTQQRARYSIGRLGAVAILVTLLAWTSSSTAALGASGTAGGPIDLARNTGTLPLNTADYSVASSGLHPITNCSTPNPGDTNYVWPMFGAYDPADHDLYVASGGVIGGQGFPAYGFISIYAPPCQLLANVHGPDGSDPYDVAYDPADRSMYVTDGGLPTIYVLQGTSIVSTFQNPGFCGASALTYDPATQAMLITNCDNTVSVFSGERLVHVFTTGFNLGADPSAIVAGPNNEIFVANWGSGNVAILNASTYHWIGEVGAGEYPNSLVWDPGRQQVLVTHYGGYLVGIDPVTNTATRIGVHSGQQLDGLAYSPADHLIFTSSEKLLVITPGDTEHSVFLNEQADVQGMFYDPSNRDVYVLDFWDTVWVIPT